MYYKRTENGAVTGICCRVQWLRYQEKHGLLVPCGKENACGILADDGQAYHVEGLPDIPLTVGTVQPIGRAEYLTLAMQLGVAVAPSVEDGAIALARADYIAMMTGIDDMEGIA